MDEQLEQKIYKNYKAFMKNRPRDAGDSEYHDSNWHDGDPATWRQKAREACVKRYSVSFQEVKRIVAKHGQITRVEEKEKQRRTRVAKWERAVRRR